MKKIISISLALLLLTGSMGIAHGTHFCGGHAVVSELMFGEKHLDCGMGMMEAAEHQNGSRHFEAPGCCENEYIGVEVGDLFIQYESSPDFDPVLVAFINSWIDFSLDYISIERPPLFHDTSPPLYTKDLTVLHQVFLI